MGIFQRGFKRGASPGQRLNLDMPSEDPFSRVSSASVSPSSLHPMVSPPHEDVPIWNILPSYQLYESTFSKTMDPSVNDLADEPPLYEDSPIRPASPEPDNGYFGQPAAAGSGTNLRTPEPRWENSILAHAHQMKHVDGFNKSVADKLKIDIVLTRNTGAKGRQPEIYSSSEMEFSQGDAIHGHVVVVNTSKEPLSFDMFSVVLEGRISVNSNEAGSSAKPLLFYKFLNMFDYNASWTPVFFEASSSAIPDYIDPVDGTTLQFPVKRQLSPGVAYKKFFNFTIPGKLLDCACETHEIPEHCVLFPSIGLDKNVFLQRLRKLREAPLKPERGPFPPVPSPPNQSFSASSIHKKKAPNLITRDYGFPDTSISYSVETKVVGKRSFYDKSCSPQNEEFVVVKEDSVPLRVVPRDLSNDNEKHIAEQHYESFLKAVKRCIDVGRKLEDGEDIVEVTRKPSTSKQTYIAGPSKSKDAATDDVYKIHMPYRKKVIAQSPRIVGLLNAIVSKREHTVRYETPYIFSTVSDLDTDKLAKLKTSIDLEYLNTEREVKGVRPPEIRGISAKIVICTVRSKKYPIPIVITQDMMFRNVLGSSDSIEKYLVSPFKNYLEELTKLVNIYGTQVLSARKQLLMDVKSLANLEVKSTSLKVDNIDIHTSGGLGHWREFADARKAEKTIDVDVDIQSLFVKDSKRPMEDKLKGALTLVPSFQSCIMCRYYYLLVEIKLGNGEVLPVKVPFKISK